MYTGLIRCEELETHLGDPEWVVVDCRFDLDDPDAGKSAYEENHVPSAVYAHLDRDLSGPPTTDEGRHPLPPPERMVETFSRLGIGPERQVVGYDAANGMYACRLWWMLRFMGHEAVALLDGGLGAWLRNGGAVRSGVESRPRAAFEGRPRREWLVVKSQVPEAGRLIDARAEARYRGEGEQRDPRGGHIPGARNYPWRRNIAADGRFLPPERIREQLEEVLEETSPEEAVFYCGSGVTACVDALAAFVAGMAIERVYVGSWSEWSRDPSLPAATGAEG